MDVKMNAAQTIYLARKLSGIPQVQLAEKIYVSQSVLSRYETGERRIPLDLIERISEQTGTIISCNAGVWSVKVRSVSPTMIEAWGSHGDDCPACASGTDCCGY